MSQYSSLLAKLGRGMLCVYKGRGAMRATQKMHRQECLCYWAVPSGRREVL
jgi:hypothetical protein